MQPDSNVDQRDNLLRTERDRLSALTEILESFTETLDFDEVLHRIVNLTLETFDADRAWLLFPASVDAEFAKIAYEATRPGFPGAFSAGESVPLEPSRPLIARTLASEDPVIVMHDDPAMDQRLREQYQIRSELITVLRLPESQPWAFGLHQCSYAREWSAEDVDLFKRIARYASLALNNARLHRQAQSEAAKVRAILDQISDPAAVYDREGALERTNAAAEKELYLFAADPPTRLALGRHRDASGRPLERDDLPSVRALHGETVNDDYLIFDPRRAEDRVVNLKAAPVRDADGAIIGSFVLSRDVTDDRQIAEREVRRRRRSEVLAGLSLQLIEAQAAYPLVDDAAETIGRSISGNALIFVYNRTSDELLLVGSFVSVPSGEAFRDYLKEHPYRAGESLAGTVFQIGRPLFFSEIRGDDVLDFSSSPEDRERRAAFAQSSLISVPIEWYGERLGVLTISLSDARRNFSPEDVEYATSLAERIGAAWHTQRLTRISQEGHRAAEELARREVDARSRLEAVLESAPIGVAVFSPDELRFEMANSRWIDFAARFGRITSDTRIVELRVSEVIPGWERDLKEVAERGDTRIQDVLTVHHDGQTSYFNRIISPVRGRYSGATQNLTVLVQDVTDQVLAKREIEGLARQMEERSARLDSILGSMTDGLWVYDVTGIAIDVNRAAVEMFGLGSRSEALARSSFSTFDLRYPDGRLIPAEDLPQSRALRGLTVPDYLAIGRNLLTGLDLDLSIACAPIESGGIVGAVLVIRDITALQELDRKKDEFLSVASHELRTPLTTIKGYTQLLTQTASDPEPGERGTYLRAVLGEIERMMGLISELLDVSRIETKRLQIYLQPMNWIEFLEQQASMFRIRHPSRKILFDTDIDETLLQVDRDRMRQVIDNLLSNALKYSPEGSDIHVVINRTDEWVRTAVVDRGIGIPQDELPQLFERFHRARNVSSRYYGGLGLGLYIARAIVEAHGGKISVESQEGQGSTFTVTLPLPDPKGA